MYSYIDPDEWECKSESKPCTACHGDLSKCNGMCNGSASWGMVRRPPEEVARIKAAKLREYESDILAKAKEITLRRKFNGVA